MQQLQAWREPGDADVNVVDVVDVVLFGPAVLGLDSDAEPEYRSEEPGAAGQVADRDGGVIDAGERVGVSVAPFSRGTCLGECEEFQQVAVVVTELERGSVSVRRRQRY
jgi:hypothetical protein